MTRARGLTAGLVVLLASCATTAALPARAPASSASASDVAYDPTARYWYDAARPLGRPPADSLRNINGSPRINDAAAFARFWRETAPVLSEWSADPRLRLNPNFVAALMAKESGYEPFATSGMPANGIAQITHIADADLQLITRDAAGFRWMHPEVRRWPRAAVVHDPAARKARTDSLVASGALSASTEYLFDPRTATRASLFWLRILGHVWTEDEWPGQYGSLARAKLAGGRPISEQDLLALVTVSYNQGHPYVADLVTRHGRDWTRHLNEESSDYLERIVHFTGIFQRAPRAR